MNAATFINERNCLIPKKRAELMAKHRSHYLVQTPVSNDEQTYAIDKVLYIDIEDEIAAYWAVVKVSYKI